MHELTLGGSILRIVETAAQREGFSRVRLLRLSVPVLGGVEVGALRFALQSLAPGTLLDGAELRLDEPASPACCRACGRNSAIADREEACPACGERDWRISDDARLHVVELLVE